MYKRTDNNHTEIVSALRAHGATVQSLAAIGKGCPDLLVGYHGSNYLLEVKDGKKSPSHRKLTPDEQYFIDMWRGQVCVVTSVNDIHTLIAGLTHAIPQRPSDSSC